MFSLLRAVAVLWICLIIVALSLGCRFSMVRVPERYGDIYYAMLNEQQKRTFLRNEKQYPDTVIDIILKESLAAGMTKEQVLYSWGRPNDRYESGGLAGVHERWTYIRFDSKTQYLYFDNGVLTSWRDWE